MVHLSSVKSIDDRVTLFSCCGSPMQNVFKFFSRGVFHLYNYEHPHFHEIFMVLIRGICNTVPNSFSVVKHIFEFWCQSYRPATAKFSVKVRKHYLSIVWKKNLPILNIVFWGFQKCPVWKMKIKVIWKISSFVRFHEFSAVSWGT